MKYGGYDFSEMLADYKSIMCLDREDLKSIIKNVLPKECISFIEKFYTEMLNNNSSFYRLRCNKVISKKY